MVIDDEIRRGDVVLVEGQGSIIHPSYSGVTYGLLHGSLPHAQVMCAQPSRTAINRCEWVKIPPLAEFIRLSELALAALRPSPTATLEIIRGPFTGASFHIARPVAAIGRGEGSDVRLRDESVSSAHATLLRKGNTWYVVDLRSVNGTFVDGYRIAGERELSTGATLRVGSVELLFRSFSNGAEDPRPRPERKGIAQRLARRVAAGGSAHAGGSDVRRTPELVLVTISLPPK